MAAFLSNSNSVACYYCLPSSGQHMEEREGRKFSGRVVELRLPVSLAGFWAVVKLSWGGGKKLCFFKRIAHMLRTV